MIPKYLSQIVFSVTKTTPYENNHFLWRPNWTRRKRAMEKGSFAPLFVHRNNTPIILPKTYLLFPNTICSLSAPPPPPRAPSIRQNYLLHPHAHVLQYFTRANDLRITTYTPPPTHPNYRKQNNGRLSFRQLAYWERPFFGYALLNVISDLFFLGSFPL